MISQTPRNGVLTKELRVTQGTADALLIETAKWNRIKRRIRKLDQRRSLHMLSGAASAFAGLAASSLLTAIAIPTGKHSEVAPWIQPGLFAAFAICTLLAATSYWFFRIESRAHDQEGADILDEMETEEDAWRG